jgi:transposase
MTCTISGAGLTSGLRLWATSLPGWRADPAARRLATIPGVGVLNATALVAAIGDGRTFNRGRGLSAWLGLVPRQATTGGKPKLLGITKRCSKYLRKLIIQAMRGLPRVSVGRCGTSRVI